MMSDSFSGRRGGILALVALFILRTWSIVFIVTVLAAFALVWTLYSGLRENALRSRCAPPDPRQDR